MVYDTETKITRRDLAKMLGLPRARVNDIAVTPACKFPRKAVNLPHNEAAFDLHQVMKWVDTHDLKDMLALANQHKQRYKLKKRAKEKVEKVRTGKIGLDNKMALNFLTRGRF